VQVNSDGWLISEHAAEHKPGWFVQTWESKIGNEARNLIKQSRLLYGALHGWRAITSDQADGVASLRQDVLTGRDTKPVMSGWKQVADALHQLQKLAKLQGFRPVIVAFPIPLALEGSFPQSSYPLRLEQIAKQRGIPFIDLDPVFRDSYQGHESLFIPYDGDHPNANGHELAARAIADFIANQITRTNLGHMPLVTQQPHSP
jgi:hypothetical protein